jgi:hypothetical protein
MAPEYFRHLVPPTIQSTTIYPLRNGDSQFHNYLRLHKRIQKGGECRLNTFFLSWIYLDWVCYHIYLCSTAIIKSDCCYLAIVLSILLRYKASYCLFGIFWSLCCLFFFDVRLLIASLVSFGHCVVYSSSI